MGKRGLEKIAQRCFVLRFAAGPYPASDRNMYGRAHRLEQKTECGRHVVHIVAAGFMHVIAGEKMNVGRTEADMPLDSPFQIHIQRGREVRSAGLKRRDLDETGRRVNGVARRVTPENVRAAID